MATTIRRGAARLRLPRPSLRRVRIVAALLLVILAALGGALAAFSAYQAEKRLDIGTVRLSTDPFHRGALDVYVPLVDWGVRFRAVRLPARLRVEVKKVNRQAAA